MIWRDVEQSVCFRAVYLAKDRSDDEKVWYLYSWIVGNFSGTLAVQTLV